MYICWSWDGKKDWNLFIRLDEPFLKGQCKGQLLMAIGQDCQNSFDSLAWTVMDKVTTRIWIL